VTTIALITMIKAISTYFPAITREDKERMALAMLPLKTKMT
jgi:hypothetical protein